MIGEGEEKDVGLGNTGWGSGLREPFIACKYCPIPSGFSISHLSHWCCSSFTHRCLFTAKYGDSACCHAWIPLELAWQLVHWAVIPIGTLEFGQTCNLSPHQTPSYVYGNLTTVESSVAVVGQIRLWTACVHLFIALYDNHDANPTLSHCQSTSDICALLIVCWSQKSRIRPSNITTRTHTYSRQSLHFTYSIQRWVRHPQNAKVFQVQINHTKILSYPLVYSIILEAKGNLQTHNLSSLALKYRKTRRFS